MAARLILHNSGQVSHWLAPFAGLQETLHGFFKLRYRLQRITFFLSIRVFAPSLLLHHFFFLLSIGISIAPSTDLSLYTDLE
jgi:hypothetical protein